MRKIVKQVRKSGNRGSEVVKGWDSYHKIACSIANRYLSYYFPTREDLGQAGALAAAVAYSELGEEAVMDQLTQSLRRTLKQQATAYGMRQRRVHKPDGRRTMQTVRPEVPFTQLQSPQSEGAAASEGSTTNNTEDFFESRMMLVGVGEWTRRQASMLYDLGR